MGALADGALSRGGLVVGVIPRFMTEVEWQHPEPRARRDVVVPRRCARRRAAIRATPRWHANAREVAVVRR